MHKYFENNFSLSVMPFGRPVRRENGPLSRGNTPLTLMGSFWEVLNFSFFFAFLRFFRFFSFFSAFLLFSQRTRGNDCNLLQKWGISLRPRLHRPRAKLPEVFGQSTMVENGPSERPIKRSMRRAHRALLIGL